ncbi:tRNA pseudouridine38-40 synthase [Oxalobacteraceae bacterium GrIS 2.11]
MKRIVLGVQYDGQSWFGWQSQPHGQTVQDMLQKALQSIAAHPVSISCAGRTDAGVHALEQIVHFDTDVDRPLNSWVRGVNAHLPSSIAVRWSKQLEKNNDDQQEFHSRFSARSRTYHYVLYNNPVRSPIFAGRVGWVFRALDEMKMREAAQLLVGVHDFSSFRAVYCQAKSPVKQMHEITIRRHGDVLVFTFRASAFLHHMVRNIMGSLIAVGNGNQNPEWIGDVLNSKDRSMAAATFMPDGLYLAKVEYDPKWDLPQQVSSLPW